MNTIQKTLIPDNIHITPSTHVAKELKTQQSKNIYLLRHEKPYIIKRKQAHWNIPRKAEALTGVDVFGWTLANQAGTTLERPMTHI